MKKILPALLISAIVFAMAPGQVFGALVAYYRFEGGVTDSSGYATNHDGTLKGTGSYVAGKFGKALSFDGSSTYVTLPLSDVKSSTGTVAGWIKWDSFNYWSRFFDFGKFTPGPPATGSAFFVANQGNDAYVSGTTHFGENPNRTSTVNISAGTWYYVALVTGLSTGATLYVYKEDGSLLDKRTQSVPGTESFDDLPTGSNYYLGESNWQVDALFNGVMDEVRIYNTALTEGEIQRLSTVPIPAAVWLLGSGLVGLVAIRRKLRKEAK